MKKAVRRLTLAKETIHRLGTADLVEIGQVEGATGVNSFTCTFADTCGDSCGCPTIGCLSQVVVCKEG